MARDETATVQLQVRLREDLRRDLEEAARARNVSLNQEIVDRLTYVRDRKGLLAEVMRLAFGDRMAGMLLALGIAMSRVAHGYRRPRGGDKSQPPPEWIDDPTIFNDMVQAAVTVINAARPVGSEADAATPLGSEGRPTRAGHGQHYALEVVTVMGGKARAMPALMPTLPAKEVEAIQELLGPAGERMAALKVRDALCSRIVSGEWKPGAPIPSESDLAREIGVTAETMRKALDLMEHQKLLTRRVGGADKDIEGKRNK